MLRDAKPAVPLFAYVLSDTEVVPILRYLRSVPARSRRPVGAN